MRYFLIVSLLPLLWACQPAPAERAPESEPVETLSDTGDAAQNWVDRAIMVHGGPRYEQADVRFVFRDRSYRSLRKGSQFRYERQFVQAGDTVLDVLTQEGFTRYRAGQKVALPDTTADKYANSVNSVLYFALLPYGLNDRAVVKTYRGIETIQGIEYTRIQVTFEEEGGGKDFEDVFLYWIHPEQHTVDFLAYEYHTDGGGIRFREAYNPRRVGGILFQDYVNYKADPDSLALEEVVVAFAKGDLVELSRIELEGVRLAD